MSRELMMSEPALAMLMLGMTAGQAEAVPGPNIGFGNDYGYGFGLASPFDPSMNMGLPGMGYGYGFGAIPYGPAASPHGMGQFGFGVGDISPAMAIAANPALSAMASTQARTLLLDPNRDSTVKVERYSFSFSPAANLVLGAASNIPTFTQQPSTSIKGQRVVMNAPVAGFVLISTLQIANVNVLVGGTEDAFTYSAGAQGVMLDLPRLDPQNRATAAGAYTGVLPPGYVAGASYQFIVTLQGPATLAGGYGQ